MWPDGEPRQRSGAAMRADVNCSTCVAKPIPSFAARGWMQQAMDRRFHFDRPPHVEWRTGHFGRTFLPLPELSPPHHHRMAGVFAVDAGLFVSSTPISALEPTPAMPPSHWTYADEELEYPRSAEHQGISNSWQARLLKLPHPPCPRTIVTGNRRRGNPSFGCRANFTTGWNQIVPDAKSNHVPCDPGGGSFPAGGASRPGPHGDRHTNF